MPAGLRRPAAKAKKKSWFQQNQVLVIGAAVGVGVLVIVLVLCLAFGCSAREAVRNQRGSDAGGRPAGCTATARGVAAQPTPSQPAPSNRRRPARRQTSDGRPPSQGGGFAAARQPTPQASRLARPTGARQAPSPEAKKEEPKKPQKPPVPDDVAKWKPEDYYRARRDNHPKLLEAIVRLGEKYPGNEKAAQCLVDLLKPLPPEKPPADTPISRPLLDTPAAPRFRAAGQPPCRTVPPQRPGVSPWQPGCRRATTPDNPAANPERPSGPRPYTPTDLTKLVETIVEALGCNGSGLARSTLEQVLAGTFATDDDKTAVEATLKTLLAHPSEESDALLLRVLTGCQGPALGRARGPVARQGFAGQGVRVGQAIGLDRIAHEAGGHCSRQARDGSIRRIRPPSFYSRQPFELRRPVAVLRKVRPEEEQGTEDHAGAAVCRLQFGGHGPMPGDFRPRTFRQLPEFPRR